MNNGGMGNTTTDVNVGLYASLIMILLTVGVAVLLTSFYRRYKRANNRTDDNN
jgi:heme/copper-type cytochrome/quinol oxidase subunit 2